MSLTAMAAPPASGETPKGKIDERMLLKRIPAPEKKTDAGSEKPLNPFKAPARTNPLKALSSSQFYGVVLFSSEWTDYILNDIEIPYGVYSFPKEIDDAATAEMLNPLFATVVSGFYRENTYGVMTKAYSEDYSEVYHYYEIDTETWKISRDVEINDPTYIACDMAYNPADGLVYGSFYNSSLNGFNFACFDPETLDYNVIAEIPDQIRYIAITADNDGNIYAINELGDFLKVDPDSGEETTVGATGIQPSPYLQSMTWDPMSGDLYWVGVSESSISLYVINPADGIAEEIAPMPASEEMVGMFVPFRESADDAPAQIDDLEASFHEGLLQGTVTFTLPSADNAGNVLTGDLNYRITVNGVDKARGTGDAGEHIEVNCETETGMTTIEATASNAAGNSPVARFIFWAGADTPKAVKNITLKNENGKAVLAWEHPEGGIHDGYVEAAITTYQIVRHPDEVIVAEAHGERTFSEMLQDNDIDLYSYSVTPAYAGNRGETTTSKRVLFGEATSVPYFEGFDNEERYNALTTATDVNNDENTWSYFSNTWHGIYVESGAARLDYHDDANDDWLITAPVRLKAGVDYSLTAQMAGGNYPVDFYNTVFEIYLSTDPDIEKFTKRLEFDNEFIKIDTFFQQLNSTFSVENDGNYHIAYHGKGKVEDYFCILIDWIKINEVSDFKAPAQISDLTLTAGEKGDPTSTISFTAPSLAYDGSPLSEITGIDIHRDGTMVKSFGSVEPGTFLTFSDSGLEEGFRIYTVAARNSHGLGVTAMDSVYIGHDTPAKITGFNATDNDEEIVLKWNPVVTGTNGGYVNADEVSYVITTQDGSVLAEGIKTTQWNEAIQKEGSMSTHIYGIAAVYGDKTGETVNSEGIVTGTPLQTPFHESFAEGRFQNEGWWTTHDTEAYGIVYEFKPLHGSSADSDREAMIFRAKNYLDSPDGVNASLNTGKISLKDVENPALIFWYFGYAEDAALTFEVYINDCGKSTEKVYELVLHPGEYMDAYKRIEVALPQYAGHDYVYVSFRGKNYDQNGAAIAIDNIQLRNVYDNNLTVDMQLPPNFMTGISNDLPVTLHNTGTSAIAAGYPVTVRQNGTVLATIEGPALDSDEVKTMRVEIRPEVMAGGEFELSAEADYADDYDADNVKTLTVNAVNAEMPMISGPAVSNDPEGVRISWQQPDMSGVGPTVEDFESYEPFIHDAFGQWLSLDIDKEADSVDTRMFCPDMGMPSSFFTYNPYAVDEDFMEIAPEYEPHSGEQYIINYNVNWPYAVYTKTNNDWLVSPRLSGRPQTIEFYAKGLVYAEPFNLLYSTTGTDIEDFTALFKMYVESDWQKFEFEIPEGTKYFAIQSTSYDTWALLIDDITYEGLCDWLEPAGFNVYRDGSLIGTTQPGTCFFVDAQAPDKCTYSVTALYNVGESAPASVEYDRMGIAAIDGSLKVTAADEAIVIRGGEGLKARVYSIDGMLVASATLDGDTRIAATPGVYVVETGDFRTKVIVR